MANVKIGWRSSDGGSGGKNAVDYERYVMEKATNVEFEGLMPGGAAQSIIDSQSFQGGRSKNVFFEVIQSFSHEESEKLGASKITDFGSAFVTKAFPDHDFLLVTHADTKHIHNHILISPINNKTQKNYL